MTLRATTTCALLDAATRAMKQASGTGDDVFDVNLPSTLSLEVEASGGSNFTTHGLAAAEAFYMQLAGGGLTYVEGKGCV